MGHSAAHEMVASGYVEQLEQDMSDQRGRAVRAEKDLAEARKEINKLMLLNGSKGKRKRTPSVSEAIRPKKRSRKVADSDDEGEAGVIANALKNEEEANVAVRLPEISDDDDDDDDDDDEKTGVAAISHKHMENSSKTHPSSAVTNRRGQLASLFRGPEPGNTFEEQVLVTSTCGDQQLDPSPTFLKSNGDYVIRQKYCQNAHCTKLEAGKRKRKPLWHPVDGRSSQHIDKVRRALTTTPNDHDGDLSPQRCVYCRTVHVPCDRALPSCSRCTKRKQKCNYTDRTIRRAATNQSYSAVLRGPLSPEENIVLLACTSCSCNFNDPKPRYLSSDGTYVRQPQMCPRCRVRTKHYPVDGRESKGLRPYKEMVHSFAGSKEFPEAGGCADDSLGVMIQHPFLRGTQTPDPTVGLQYLPTTHDRRLVRWKYVEGRKHAEIADLLSSTQAAGERDSRFVKRIFDKIFDKAQAWFDAQAFHIDVSAEAGVDLDNALHFIEDHPLRTTDIIYWSNQHNGDADKANARATSIRINDKTSDFSTSGLETEDGKAPEGSAVPHILDPDDDTKPTSVLVRDEERPHHPRAPLHQNVMLSPTSVPAVKLNH